MIYYTKNSTETKRIGKKLAKFLKIGDIVGLIGELGSGKTTMIKGIVKELTKKNAISPSFTLVNEYYNKVPVYHFDFYRINKKEEIKSIGWEDYLNRGILLIEWADKILDFLPENTILVNISITGQEKRKIEIILKKNKKKLK